jgi:hypothetical protein
MINVEERITYLDNLMAELARAQVQREIASKAADARIERHIAEMKEDRRRLQEGTLQMQEDTRRMKEDTRRMKQAWGDLANKMGTVAEDVVAPNIPRLAIEEFGFGEVEDLMVRVSRASRRGKKRRREWDVICSGPEKVIVVEVKSTPSIDKIREVPDRLAEFFDFFPGYDDRELIGIFASWSIRSELLPVISASGLFGIAMGEDTMEIVARPGE